MKPKAKDRGWPKRKAHPRQGLGPIKPADGTDVEPRCVRRRRRLAKGAR